MKELQDVEKGVQVDEQEPQTPLSLVLDELDNLKALGFALELKGMHEELPELEALGRMVVGRAEKIWDALNEWEEGHKIH